MILWPVFTLPPLQIPTWTIVYILGVYAAEECILML